MTSCLISNFLCYTCSHFILSSSCFIISSNFSGHFLFIQRANPKHGYFNICSIVLIFSCCIVFISSGMNSSADCISCYLFLRVMCFGIEACRLSVNKGLVCCALSLLTRLCFSVLQVPPHSLLGLCGADVCCVGCSGTSRSRPAPRKCRGVQAHPLRGAQVIAAGDFLSQRWETCPALVLRDALGCCSPFSLGGFRPFVPQGQHPSHVPVSGSRAVQVQGPNLAPCFPSSFTFGLQKGYGF